ncbi:MAG: nickel-dependent hydrogenase large subunit [Syntrophobacteraceae bacterium]|nr:nickel-dependent hydrogenase large subunit [Syntrophobacteraceae bacterium]
MTRVVIDPVTRIEGHLRIETEIEDGKVNNAWSTATLFRGIELILNGRDPKDAPLITQRLCGVCTYIHMLTSSRCIEDTYGVVIPDNARIVRNLLLGAQFVHDHIVHFYHLQALDWVDVVSALSADPAVTEQLSKSLSPSADPIDFAAVKSRLQNFVDTGKGKLGPFSNAYWGHEAYSLESEENLLLVAHYLEAMKKQAEIARLHAILGGKNPHLQTVVVGGITCSGELGKQANLDLFRQILSSAKKFVETVYMPDVEFLAKTYQADHWHEIGGYDHFMSFGEFPQGPDEPADLFLPRGIVLGRDLDNVHPVRMDQIYEHVAHSWYEGSEARHPYSGQTAPAYNGLDMDDRYSWLKAPRHGEHPMEVGPLARVLVGCASHHGGITDAVADFLGKVGMDRSGLFSTLGRTAARAIETSVIVDAMFGWLETLEDNIRSGVNQVYEYYAPSSQAKGEGFNEAPRGALGHLLMVNDGKIGNYQLVVPSTWNFSPRCSQNKPGPVEQALLGTPVVDPAKPLELLRILHSFDPCIACGVHVIDTRNQRTFEVRVQ